MLLAQVDVSAAAEAQALIAEARAHARRRRRRVALAVAATFVLVAAGLLIAFTAQGGGRAAGPHPRPTGAAGPAGVVTGHLAACAGLPFGHPVTPGTVTVLRGKESWKPAGHGTYQLVLPATAVAHEYISDNYRQTFRFALPPGRYVITGRYEAERPGTVGPLTLRDVTVSAGRIIRADLPNLCE